jgi:hypothetical protein
MPYELFVKIIHEDGEKKKKWCTRNKETGKVTEYDSQEKRKTGIKMRHAIESGWKPTRKK